MKALNVNLIFKGWVKQFIILTKALSALALSSALWASMRVKACLHSWHLALLFKSDTVTSPHTPHQCSHARTRTVCALMPDGLMTDCYLYKHWKWLGWDDQNGACSLPDVWLWSSSWLDLTCQFWDQSAIATSAPLQLHTCRPKSRACTHVLAVWTQH